MAIIKEKMKKINKKKLVGIIDPNVGNYEKHPFFVKKANEAKEFLRKAGLPEEYYKQVNKKNPRKRKD